MADMLRKMRQTMGGSSIVALSTSQDKVKLMGNIKQEFAAKQEGFTFHT